MFARIKSSRISDEIQCNEKEEARQGPRPNKRLLTHVWLKPKTKKQQEQQTPMVEVNVMRNKSETESKTLN